LTDLTRDRDEKINKLQNELDAARSDVQTKLNIGLKWQKRTKELMSGINETKETHAKAISDLQAQVTSLNQEIETLQNENANVKQEAETKSKRADDLQSRIAGLEQSLAEREEAVRQASVASSTTIPVPAVSESPVNASAELQGSLDQAQQRIAVLETQLAEAVQARDNAVAERTLSQAAPTAVVADPSAEQALKEELVSRAATLKFEYGGTTGGRD
jgi:predicted  nucleic acid-binding Zn-ribbon protein